MKKNAIASILVIFFILILSSVYNGKNKESKTDISCKDFTAVGEPASSLNELLDKDATKKQVELVRSVISDDVYHIELTDSPRRKAFELINGKGLTPKFISESIGMTRAFCFINPDKNMKGIAIESFDSMLDAVAKKMNLRDSTQ